MVIVKPAVAIVNAVVGSNIGIRHLLERREVVFIVRIEYYSSVIDRYVIKFLIVLSKLTIYKVNVYNKIIFRHVRIFIVYILKVVFKSFKLVK